MLYSRIFKILIVIVTLPFLGCYTAAKYSYPLTENNVAIIKDTFFKNDTEYPWIIVDSIKTANEYILKGYRTVGINIKLNVQAAGKQDFIGYIRVTNLLFFRQFKMEKHFLAVLGQNLSNKTEIENASKKVLNEKIKQ
ncbi:hypothetical protein FO440_07460 [Mucilaginibacter corticis]|uniref:Uncharacterized protein n=1 Tax=Mucilaginibacter corticis TaxID=2597670 RepID=A0A556MVV2_9SPHI|nr:hypothetical protein [Mucilaginibacter corticis]TSJ44003.1 hypothetical protein FO440_07460 [Mucilaginibacter corticis]